MSSIVKGVANVYNRNTIALIFFILVDPPSSLISLFLPLLSFLLVGLFSWSAWVARRLFSRLLSLSLFRFLLEQIVWADGEILSPVLESYCICSYRMSSLTQPHLSLRLNTYHVDFEINRLMPSWPTFVFFLCSTISHCPIKISFYFSPFGDKLVVARYDYGDGQQL